jgi:O-antigen ligase
MWDHANQYVAVATGSGLIPLIFFIAIIVHAFSLVGRARRRKGQDRKRQLAVWSLGAALTANLVAFFGISYFDQTIIVWWGQVAMIAAFYAFVPARSPASTVFASVPIERSLPRVPLSY